MLVELKIHYSLSKSPFKEILRKHKCKCYRAEKGNYDHTLAVNKFNTLKNNARNEMKKSADVSRSNNHFIEREFC